MRKRSGHNIEPWGRPTPHIIFFHVRFIGIVRYKLYYDYVDNSLTIQAQYLERSKNIPIVASSFSTAAFIVSTLYFVC